MPRFPTWTWLPSRYVASGAETEKSGPPPVSLPTVEQLDPRVLLSTSEVELTPLNIEKHIDKASTQLFMLAATDIFAKLGDIKGESLDDRQNGEIAQLGQQVHKLDWIISKYHDDILNLKLSPNESTDVAHSVNDVLFKMETLAADLDGGAHKILPAVQNLENVVAGEGLNTPGTGGLLGDLSALAASDIKSIPADERSLLVKLNDEFWKLDDVAIDFKLDVLRGVPLDVAIKIADSKVQQEYLKIKLDQVLISSFLSEPDQGDFNGIIKGAIDTVNGIVHPSPGPVLEIAFTGGVTIPGGAGDTIA